MSQENVKTVQSMYAAFASGDVPSVLGSMDPEEMEGLLADTVLGEFKKRLHRVGIEYQTPARP